MFAARRPALKLDAQPSPRNILAASSQSAPPPAKTSANVGPSPYHNTNPSQHHANHWSLCGRGQAFFPALVSPAWRRRWPVGTGREAVGCSHSSHFCVPPGIWECVGDFLGCDLRERRAAGHPGGPVIDLYIPVESNESPLSRMSPSNKTNLFLRRFETPSSGEWRVRMKRLR